MKKIVLMVVASSLIIGMMLAPAEAAKKKKKAPKPRVATAPYASPAVGVGGVGGGCVEPNGCVSFGIGATEAFVKIEATDATGQPIFLRIGQDDGSGSFVGIASVCGSSGDAIPVTPGIPVQVFIYPLGIDPPCPGPATTGTVQATFSSTP